MHLDKWAPWVRRRSSPDFATLGLSQQRSFFGTVGFSVYILIYILFRYPKNRLVIIFAPKQREASWLVSASSDGIWAFMTSMSGPHGFQRPHTKALRTYVTPQVAASAA